MEADGADSSIDYTRTQFAFILNEHYMVLPSQFDGKEKVLMVFPFYLAQLGETFYLTEILVVTNFRFGTTDNTRLLILLFHKINLKSHPITYINGPFYQSHIFLIFSFKQKISVTALFTLYHVLRFAVVLRNFVFFNTISWGVTKF